MNAFFEGVGDGDSAGIWDRMPAPRAAKPVRKTGGGRS
jgi:hypothetical protein